MLTVVMPAYNEAAYLADAVLAVTKGLEQRGLDHEIVVVENGSTDGTAEVAQGLAREHATVRAISIPEADYGIALRTGLLEATGTVVVNFDVDYFDLGFLATALARMEVEPDVAVVVGSKRAPGARDERGAGRRAITAVFTGMLRYGFGLRVSDTHGMKALRRAAVLPVVERCRFGTDLFDTELVLRAERAGLRVVEEPVVVEESRPSRTSILRRGTRTVAGLVRLRVALWRDLR